jgi:hypothetical protein
MPKTCKKCGNEYTGWFCPHCRKKRRRSQSSRKWNAASAQARMLGGWEGVYDLPPLLERDEAAQDRAGEEISGVSGS